MRLAASAVAVLTVLSLSAQAAPATAAPLRDPRPASSEVAVPGTPPRAAPAPPTSVQTLKPAVTTSKFDCAKVKANPRKYIPKGRTEVGCIVSTPPAVATAAAAAAAPAVSCGAKTKYVWYLSRRTACLWGWPHPYQIVSSTGAVTGTATIETATDLVLDQRLSWTESWYATMTAATGKLTTMTVIIDKACGTGCTVRNSPTTQQTLTVGKTITGTNTFAAAPLGRSEYSHLWSMRASDPTNDTIPGDTWGFASPVRCDRILAPAGCVIPASVPTFPVSFAATPMINQAIWYFQASFPDNFGAATKLRHLADTTTQQVSHDGICAGFVPDSRVAVDTCFQFPFDSNYEAGYLQGSTLPDCAETRVALLDTGAYQTYIKHAVDYTERCFINHSPVAEVDLLKQQLADWGVQNRVIDQDPYSVSRTD